MGLEVEEVVEVQEKNPQPTDDRPQPREGSRGLEWQPYPSAGVQVGIALTLVPLACAVAALIYVVGRPIAIDSFAAAVAGLAGLLLALFFGITTYGRYSLRYYLSSQELTVAWLWTRETVPLGRIEGVYGGHRLGKKAQVEGVSLPGHHVGRSRAEGLGRLKFYGTTLEPSAALIVATARVGYALTPSDLEEFRRHLIERLEALPVEEVETTPEVRTGMPRLLRLSVLSDGVAAASLAVALLVLLGSFGYVSARFPGLPELMPLHFNFAGEPDLIGPPRDAFRMPIIGLLILVANGVLAAAVHGWQRDAARILTVATLFVELVMLVAVLRVVH